MTFSTRREMILPEKGLRLQQRVRKLKAMKLKAAADLVESSIHETFAYFAYPPHHWLKIRTNNPMEWLLKEARRRTKMVGALPLRQFFG